MSKFWQETDAVLKLNLLRKSLIKALFTKKWPGCRKSKGYFKILCLIIKCNLREKEKEVVTRNRVERAHGQGCLSCDLK